MRGELSLLNATENCSSVTEFCSVSKTPKQIPSMKSEQNWSLRRIWTATIPYHESRFIEPMILDPLIGLNSKNTFKTNTENNRKKSHVLSRRYYNVLESGNVGQLNDVPETIRANVIKSLIVISKYIGCYEQFKASMKSYGIKIAQPDALAAFVRIYSNTNSNL
jgi:hypothetical protein